MPAVGCMVWGNLSWDSSSPLCVASQTSGGWTQLRPLGGLGVVPGGKQKLRGLSRPRLGSHTASLLHNVLLVKVSRRPTQTRGVEKEALPLDERNKVKAYCKGACHRVGLGGPAANRVPQSAIRDQALRSSCNGQLLPDRSYQEEVALIQNLTSVPIKAGEKCAFHQPKRRPHLTQSEGTGGGGR